MDGGAWWAAVHGVTKSRIRLSTHAHTSWLSWGFPGGSDGKEYACNASCYSEGGASWPDLPDRISLPITPCVFPHKPNVWLKVTFAEGEILEYCSVDASRYLQCLDGKKARHIVNP